MGSYSPLAVLRGGMKGLEAFVQKHWYLDQVPVLDGLTDAQKAYFLSHTIRRRYSAKTTLFSPGDRTTSLYVVDKGKVKIYALTSDGREVIYWYSYPGDLFGLAEVCGGELRNCYADTLEETVAIEVPYPVMQRLIADNPQLAAGFIKFLGARLRAATETIKSLASAPADKRLAGHLLKLGQQRGRVQPDGTIALLDHHTHQEIGNVLGLSRQTVTATLSDFRQRGLIDTGHRDIILRDPQRLSRLLEAAHETWH